jgi:NAD(P)-dependent dehydrogenase (short-subunit alcohol dehydrogenase family)
LKRRRFEDKVVVITGGASGIGLATARRFARADAVCALLDLDEEALARCEEEFADSGHPVMIQPCDVTSKEECMAAMDVVIERFGGIDLLFNNAGITQRSRFVETKTEVYEKVMAVNFFGSLYCTKAAIESLVERRGMIVVNESLAGVAPLVGRTGYSASKHALHGLFTSLRAELKGKGVDVMIVCPGFIQTNLQKRALGGDGRITTRPQSFIGRQQSAQSAAEEIFRAACKRKPMLVLTAMGKLGYLVSRIAPHFYERQMARTFKAEL